MTCPICKIPTTWERNPTRPFCSERCKLIDLGRWASGQYRIPGESLSITAPDGNPTHPDSPDSAEQGR